MPWRYLFCILLAVLPPLGCDRPPTEKTPSPSGSAPPDSPNVLLITLDTTRADRLGCYGHEKARTPALDGLAATGVRFERAYCQVPLTLPSHASLMTGTNPPTNGLTVNGAAVLGPNLATLAETFQRHGYRTGAFISAWVLNSAFGLARGFDHYDDRIGAEGDSLYQERIGDKTCDAALAWLGDRTDGPFFAWVHFFDPHHPYAPPAPFREQFADAYDGEIAFMDAQIARLLEWLDRTGCRDRTLIVVVGDHGEAFGEHGETEHGMFIYEATMRVPLIIGLPANQAASDRIALTAPRTVAAAVGIVDVAPTVLDLFGYAVPASMQGRSLRDLIANEQASARPIYCESRYAHASFGWSGLRGLIVPPWKYIAAPRAELYNLDVDPGELNNLAAEEPAAAAEMRMRLMDLVAKMPNYISAKIELSDESLRMLESLGYVGATMTDDDEADVETVVDESLRDPKDMVGVFNGFQQARRLNRQGRHADAAVLLQTLTRQSPESDELFAELGESYLKLGKITEAESAYLKSLRADPANARKLCLLGDAIFRQNRVDDAVACYQKALQVSPHYGQAYNRMGMVYTQKKQYLEAARYLGKHVELAPDSPHALTNLANVLTQIGRHDEAIMRLSRALEINPRFAPAHRYLWQVLQALNRIPESMKALRAACRALPEDVALKRTLAELIVRFAKPAGLRPAIAVDLHEAVNLGLQCCRLEPENPQNFELLGSAQAAMGDLAAAIESAQHALELAQDQGRNELAARIAERLRRYQRGERP